MSAITESPLEAGRTALARWSWREAHTSLAEADAQGLLGPEDLEGLAEAAWWIGKIQECVSARERAYEAHLDRGDPRRAAYVALLLCVDHMRRHNLALASGWMQRAERLLESEPECIEQGYLELFRGVAAAFVGGDRPAGVLHLARAVEIGRRFGDRDLVALGQATQGEASIAGGDFSRGMSLLEEAMISAVTGELSPAWTGQVYCAALGVCRGLGDLRRAVEWTEATREWCERNVVGSFPGECRVQRAQIMRLRGSWTAAEEEIVQACDEIGDVNFGARAFGMYELGELLLRRGDLAGADRSFRQAHELGWSPQPGLALVRLAEGKIEEAAASLRSALIEEPNNRMVRAGLLPAQVEVAVRANDLTTATAAADELEAIATDFDSSGLQAAAGYARGQVELAAGNAAAARSALRRAWRGWQELDAPYEAARARALLGEALAAEGDTESAVLELEAADTTFDRLGAALDARRVAAVLRNIGAKRAAERRVERTFMFTDIVDSTKLAEALGEDEWTDLLRWHDQTLRSLLSEHHGEEVKHQGDGFFAAFAEAEHALRCAVAIQRTLAGHRRSHGFSPRVRIGLHAAEATREGSDYHGVGVHQAARVAALAGDGEILASERTVPAGTAVSDVRSVQVKGITDPVRVVTVDWS